MKVQSIELKHFKRFRELSLDFTDPETGLAKDLIVLVGMNGSGKSTILQAIAATLGCATGRLSSASQLNWSGFDLGLASSSWKLPPNINLQVEFSKEELDALISFYSDIRGLEDGLVKPSMNQFINLGLFGDKIKADTDSDLANFRSREYSKKFLKNNPDGFVGAKDKFEIFERAGTIFWYTEQRTSTSLTPEELNQTLEINDDLLRDRLSKWMIFHQLIELGKIKELKPGQRDLFAELEKMYQVFFPNYHFEGTIPNVNIDDILSEPKFYLFDGSNQYEISEMSGGERAIFPILLDFVNWNINNSVILIDELELHLHPPLQQALLRALPKLGKNNQFIITTHSDYIASMVFKSNIIRVDTK